MPQGYGKTPLRLFRRANVALAYHFKRKGLKVIANNLLRFPYHLAKAVIENSSITSHILRVGDRTMQHWKARYEKYGHNGLYDRRRSFGARNLPEPSSVH